MSRDSLEANSPPGRARKLHWKALARDVQENPDKRLIERAKEFNVWTNSIWYALAEMDIKYKPTVRNLDRENLEIMTNCFVSIQREFETCLDHTAPRKIQKLYINKKFDETIKNGLLFG